MRLQLRLSQDAQQDLDEIADYTLANWGVEQMSRYIDGLEAAFGDLCENPGQGKAREDLFAGLRAMPFQSHTIFYRRTKTFLLIHRVLHQSRDAVAAVRDVP